MNLSAIGLPIPDNLLLMENDRHLIIGNNEGLVPIDVESAKLAELQNKQSRVNCLVKLQATSD